MNAKVTSGKEKVMPFSKRVKKLDIPDAKTTKIGGSMQMTFVTSNKRREEYQQKKVEEYRNTASQKRGIKDLGLKKVKVKFFRRKK